MAPIKMKKIKCLKEKPTNVAANVKKSLSKFQHTFTSKNKNALNYTVKKKKVAEGTTYLRNRNKVKPKKSIRIKKVAESVKILNEKKRKDRMNVMRDMLAGLKNYGVTRYENSIILEMLEYAKSYISEILIDAKAYSFHARKRNIDVEDIKLAVKIHLRKTGHPLLESREPCVYPIYTEEPPLYNTSQIVNLFGTNHVNYASSIEKTTSSSQFLNNTCVSPPVVDKQPVFSHTVETSKTHAVELPPVPDSEWYSDPRPPPPSPPPAPPKYSPISSDDETENAQRIYRYDVQELSRNPCNLSVYQYALQFYKRTNQLPFILPEFHTSPSPYVPDVYSTYGQESPASIVTSQYLNPATVQQMAINIEESNSFKQYPFNPVFPPTNINLNIPGPSCVPSPPFPLASYFGNYYSLETGHLQNITPIISTSTNFHSPEPGNSLSNASYNDGSRINIEGTSHLDPYSRNSLSYPSYNVGPQINVEVTSHPVPYSRNSFSNVSCNDGPQINIEGGSHPDPYSRNSLSSAECTSYPGHYSSSDATCITPTMDYE